VARTLAGLAAALGLAGSAVPLPLQELASAPVAVVLVRHMEKAANDPRDPDLSDAGRARAAALDSLLARSGVTHLFATEWKRTSQTLEPLARRTRAPIEVVPAGSPDELIARLLALPAGATAVVAGHSNTIPALARRLGGTIAGTTSGPQGDSLADAEYGRLVLLVLPAPGSPHRRALRTIELHVGD